MKEDQYGADMKEKQFIKVVPRDGGYALLQEGSDGYFEICQLTTRKHAEAVARRLRQESPPIRIDRARQPAVKTAAPMRPDLEDTGTYAAPPAG